MTETPRHMWVQVHDVRLSLYEWPGDGPPVLFTHATSFHARCWDAVIAQLPGCHCLAVDQRGHGQSDKPTPPNLWRCFGEDLAALAERLQLRGAIGVGHSLGGFATALAAALVPEAFAALLLLDPVIQPRHLYHGRTVGEHFTARRRNHWPSAQAMVERFAERAPFNRWQPAVLHDYCTYGLLPAPNGDGYVLACPPAIEADVYAGTSECDIYPELATVQVPTVVLRADRFNSNPTSDLSSSPTAPDLARHFRHGRDVPLPDHSHFIPMEDPALVAQHVRALLARV